jgi:hypothetical protein
MQISSGYGFPLEGVSQDLASPRCCDDAREKPASLKFILISYVTRSAITGSPLEATRATSKL